MNDDPMLRAVEMLLQLVGIDTDNDTLFINETVKDYCEANRIECTQLVCRMTSPPRWNG